MHPWLLARAPSARFRESIPTGIPEIRPGCRSTEVCGSRSRSRGECHGSRTVTAYPDVHDGSRGKAELSAVKLRCLTPTPAVPNRNSYWYAPDEHRVSAKALERPAKRARTLRQASFPEHVASVAPRSAVLLFTAPWIPKSLNSKGMLPRPTNRASLKPARSRRTEGVTCAAALRLLPTSVMIALNAAAHRFHRN